MSEPESFIGDPARLRDIYARFPSGVAVLCAYVEGEPHGLLLSSYTSVSLDPPLVSVCVQLTSSTWTILRRADRLGLSLLGEDQHEVCRYLSASAHERFDHVGWTKTMTGAVFITGATTHMKCSIHQAILAGDHEIVVLKVLAADIHNDQAPLVFHGHRYRKLA